MRRLTALVVVAALATLVPMVAAASLISEGCCAAKKAAARAAMSCCTATQCSMSQPGPIEMPRSDAETTPSAPKTATPGPSVLVGDATALESVSAYPAYAAAAIPAVSVDRRLALLSTYLI